MELTTAEVSKVTGVTSRTLRHYDAIGLLEPTRTGAGGIRRYDESALVRLQRILVLRELGMGLDEIGRALDRGGDVRTALARHADALERERDRLSLLVATVRRTVSALEKGAPLMADEMFEGFDHTQYKDEVVERWGQEAYDRSDAWWREKGEAGRRAHLAEHLAIADVYADLSARGVPAEAPETQAVAKRHAAWIQAGWGDRPVTAEALMGLGDMYVADERFAVNYTRDGRNYAAYVRDALAAYAVGMLDAE